MQITTKYSKDLRKQRRELQKCNKQSTRIFMIEWFAIEIIMDTRTIAAVKFRKRLGFKQCNVIMTQEQYALTKLDRYFNAEDKTFQHCFGIQN